MITINELTMFFGWCAVLNIGVLLISTVLVILMKETVTRLHGKLFGVEPNELPAVYFEYLGNYKIATLVLSIVPYVALKLMV